MERSVDVGEGWGYYFLRMAGVMKKPSGSVGTVVLLIGTMALGLAVGLGVLGFWDGWNAWMTGLWRGLGEGMRDVPTVWVMGFAVVMAYGIPGVMLLCPGMWRRWCVWGGMMLLGAGWVPVLALAAWQMPPAVPLVAGLWSGLCVMIFSAQHVLPCDVAAERAGAVEVKRVVREVVVNEEAG